MIVWEMLQPWMTPDHLGLISFMLLEDDPRPAKDQFNERYAHGGGWNSMKGFKLDEDNRLHYPGDPPLRPLARCQFRNELILFYDYAWVAIIHRDRYYEVCRMD